MGCNAEVVLIQAEGTGLLVNSPSDLPSVSFGLRVIWSTAKLLDALAVGCLHETFHLDEIFPFREAQCGQ